MKIVFVSREYLPSMRAGGIATYVYESARWLVDHGHKVIVVCASDDVRRESESFEYGVRVVRLSGGDFYIPTVDSLWGNFLSHWRVHFFYRSYRKKLQRRLLRVVREDKPDIIEFAEYGNEALYWRGQEEVPWVVRIHGPTLLNRETGGRYSKFLAPWRWYYGRKEFNSILCAKIVHAPSRAIADKIVEFVDQKPSQIVVVPNAITADRWRFSNSSRDKTRQGVNVVFAGTIVDSKGCGDLVDAISMLREGMDIRLSLIGRSGRLGRRFKRKILRDPELARWLSIPGVLSRDQLANQFCNADLVVFPSWWEPFGLVCIEAMATGALVVGSSAGGMAEIIDDGVNGFLVSPKKPLVLAKKIEQVLAIPEDKKMSIRHEAVQTVLRKFETTSVMEKQLAYYQELISITRSLQKDKSGHQ